MGNTSSNIFKDFVETLNERNIIKANEDTIASKIEAVFYLIEGSSNSLEDFKRENENSNYYNLTTEEVRNTNKTEENDNNSNRLTEYTNFCKIISKLIGYSFNNTHLHLYSKILEIMKKLSNEKVFVEYFLENSIDNLNLMMFKSDFKYSVNFIVQGIILFQKIIDFFYSHPSLVAKNIIHLNKIFFVPKLLSDNLYFSKKEVRLQLALLLRDCINFFILIKRKDNEFATQKEVRKIVRPTLNSYHQNSLFQNLSSTITKKEMSDIVQKKKGESYRFVVANIFVLLLKIKSVIRDQLIRPNQEFIYLFMVLQTMYIINENGKKKLNPLYGHDYKLIKEILIFAIDYFIENFQGDSHSHNSINSDLYKDEKLFELYENYNNKDIKFLICCLFFVVGLDFETFQFFKKENIVSISKNHICQYLIEIFSRDSSEEEVKDKTRYLDLLVKILKLITKRENGNKITHIKYYEEYLDIVILLFYINYPDYRNSILEILFFFTLYINCKKKFVQKKENISKIFERLDEVFKEIENISILITNLISQKGEIITKKELLQFEYKKPLEENVHLFDELIAKTVSLFSIYANDFFLLIMVINNLLMVDVNDSFFINSISRETFNLFFEYNTGLLFKYQKFFEEDLNNKLKEILINFKGELVGKYYLFIPFTLYNIFVKSNIRINFNFCK